MVNDSRTRRPTPPSHTSQENLEPWGLPRRVSLGCYTIDVTAQPYRVPADRPDHYAEAWSRLRRRRLVRRLSFGVAVYAFATLLVFTLKGVQFGVVTTMKWNVMVTGMALGVVFLGAAFALARYLVPFVCPRCAQPFFHGFTTEIGFTKNCVHCGLEVGSPMPVTEDRESSESESAG